MDLSSSLDCCILFMAFACFWDQIHLGKILSIFDHTFNSSLFPTWGNFKPPMTCASSWVLHLPNTKMEGKRGEDIILTKQDHLNPINALFLHYTANYNNTSQNIASYHNMSNSITVLTQCLFLEWLNTILRHHNFSIITGHCFKVSKI